MESLANLFCSKVCILNCVVKEIILALKKAPSSLPKKLDLTNVHHWFVNIQTKLNATCA